jgi:MYXO-CTERM domain-containing protein
MDGTAFAGPGPQSCGTTVPVGSGGAGGGGAGGSGGGSAGAGTSGGASVGGAAGAGGAGGAAGAHSGGVSAGGAAGSGTGGANVGGASGFGGASVAGAFSGGSGGASAGASSSAAGSSAAGARSGSAGAAGHAASSSGDSSGCSCRPAPAAPSRSGLASLALLALGYAFRRRRQRRDLARNSWAALGVSLAATVLGCSSKSDAGEANQTTSNNVEADAGDCTSRAEGVTQGLNKVSSGGYSFTLTALDPAQPVQSSGQPGNTWTISIADPSGAPVTGAVLQISSYMPDHGHYAPTAVAVEQGGGVYQVDDLVLPMPGLYAVTLSLSLTSSEKESVALSLCMTTSS